MPSPKPIFARRIFWDVDFDKLDYDGKASFIIERVFSWGDIPDVREARKYYGDEKVLNVLLVAEEIPSFSLHLWSVVFSRPLSDFRSIKNEEDKDPYLVKRAYFERLYEIHGLPPFPEPDPVLMRMS